MARSHESGELALQRERMTVFSSMKLGPNTMRAMATVMAALSRTVNEAMNGLSDSVRWAWIMSNWRLLTGRSTGAHRVPPAWWREGAMYVRLAKLWKSSIVA